MERIWKTIKDNSSTNSGDADLIKKVKTDISLSWKSSPSLFDRDIVEEGTDYPKMDGNPFEPIRHLEKINANMDSSRPIDFSKAFTRMWLSNVPDYTHGPINMALYVVPNVEISPQATVAANCLLNTELWPDDDRYYHTYTFLAIKELPKFLGCRVISISPYTTVVLVSSTFPIPLKELASRNELTIWLTRIRLCTIRPWYSRPTPCLVHYPDNLVVFVDLLIHLDKVGFLAHWLTEFLGRVLLNDLVTDIIPSLGVFPILLEERTQRVPMHRINLDPWNLELKTVLAGGYKVLPLICC